MRPNTEDMRILIATKVIVSAFLAHQKMNSDKVPILIATVKELLSRLIMDKSDPDKISKNSTRISIDISKSVQHEYIVCLSCGKHLKQLRRHIEANHNMNPKEYRLKWALPHDYPMVSGATSIKRSRMAKAIRLGSPSVRKRIK